MKMNPDQMSDSELEFMREYHRKSAKKFRYIDRGEWKRALGFLSKYTREINRRRKVAA